MVIALYTLTSPLHNEEAVNAASASFIQEIENAIGMKFIFKGNDFSSYGCHDLSLIYVRTGGTEGLFREILPLTDGTIRILTSGKSNSLAASMEILAYLNKEGRKGEIIHGNTGYIAERIKNISLAEHARKSLKGRKLGLIGQQSDWLISSDPDREAIYGRLGMELIDIPIEELIEEVNNPSPAADSSDIAREAFEMLEKTAPETVRKYAAGAISIYYALKNIIARYDLYGLTLRCFDLLDTVGNTGCLALAILNSEGYPAGCEGDVPTLVTMAIGKALTGVCGFQANPSRIDPHTGEILFAHCTIPLDMIRSYSFNTHFESGIGVAVCGQMQEGPATILKVSGDIGRTFCCEAELLANQYEKGLCRTQMILSIKDEADRKAVCSEYFLKNPIGNHHVILPGHIKSLFEAFMNC